LSSIDDKLIKPEITPIDRPEEAESLDVWGFRDTRFDFTESGEVTIRGSRYELSGKVLPRFLPWVRETLQCNVDPADVHQPHYPTFVSEPRLRPEFLTTLQKILAPNQIETDGEIRLRHGHGHTQEEMYAIKYTRLGRIPDVVVYPDSEDQVCALVEAAKTHNVSLIPYGG
jgi:alkyldihydroxyacetonephosphate synthase